MSVIATSGSICGDLLKSALLVSGGVLDVDARSTCFLLSRNLKNFPNINLFPEWLGFLQDYCTFALKSHASVDRRPLLRTAVPKFAAEVAGFFGHHQQSR
jgi:hypothetical protein